MPKIYKKNCERCKKPYKGQGLHFCSKSCAVKSRVIKEETREKMRKILMGNKRALGKKYGKDYRERISQIVREQWKDPELRERKIRGLKRIWTERKRKKQAKITAKQWKDGKLNSNLLPHGIKHWNYNPDRIKCYRKGIYFSKGQRKRLLKKRCEWCGSKKNLQLDHKIAIINDGTNEDKNAQTLCRKCNTLKRDLIDFWGRKNKWG